MDHRLIDRRSLELNRLVAEKNRRQPELMDVVRDKLELLVEDSHEGQRLRQSTPFSGILDQKKRLEVFRRFASAEVTY
ncbi:MAG: hypothetical protein E6Q40_03150 [Cupriavidus sp.]|nr:MAG: hypothetical protein E6Q40_03150 [Cupriavidus sp.]